MNLLVTQLRNQDPSSPMDTNQMISQTTQLATMEKLTNMDTTATENFSLQMRTAAAAMIGQNITWSDKDGTAHTGIADSVSFAYGVPRIKVGELDIPLDVISGVTSGAKPGTETPVPSTPVPETTI